jgi:hypothetical protein
LKDFSREFAGDISVQVSRVIMKIKSLAQLFNRCAAGRYGARTHAKRSALNGGNVDRSSTTEALLR